MKQFGNFSRTSYFERTGLASAVPIRTTTSTSTKNKLPHAAA